jgi:hypothetical protein
VGTRQPIGVRRLKQVANVVTVITVGGDGAKKIKRPKKNAGRWREQEEERARGGMLLHRNMYAHVKKR